MCKQCCTSMPRHGSESQSRCLKHKVRLHVRALTNKANEQRFIGQCPLLTLSVMGITWITYQVHVQTLYCTYTCQGTCSNPTCVYHTSVDSHPRMIVSYTCTTLWTQKGNAYTCMSHAQTLLHALRSRACARGSLNTSNPNG